MVHSAWRDKASFKIDMKEVRHQGVILNDIVKAVNKDSREVEHVLLGSGFHATHRGHHSKNTYTAK